MCQLYANWCNYLQCLLEVTSNPVTSFHENFGGNFTYFHWCRQEPHEGGCRLALLYLFLSLIFFFSFFCHVSFILGVFFLTWGLFFSLHAFFCLIITQYFSFKKVTDPKAPHINYTNAQFFI